MIPFALVGYMRRPSSRRAVHGLWALMLGGNSHQALRMEKEGKWMFEKTLKV